jgi:hypothetical protein
MRNLGAISVRPPVNKFIRLEVLLKPGKGYSSGGTPEAWKGLFVCLLSVSSSVITSGTWEDLGHATARP